MRAPYARTAAALARALAAVGLVNGCAEGLVEEGATRDSGSSGEGGLLSPDGGAEADVIVSPCGSKCGLEELCDAEHAGLDDDCDGQVDEVCGCAAGEAHACFKGDPAYHGVSGCFDGTQKCTENGVWGPCIGGVHAEPPDDCYKNDTSSCHAIAAAPFAHVDLKSGTGSFSANAAPGSEAWTVACPPGVDPCPAVSGADPPDDFKPLQSGEYTVTYSKQVEGSGALSCVYPLIVGARGLRVELEWERSPSDKGVDLDLHVHRPSSDAPWAIAAPAPADCAFSSCVFAHFAPPEDAFAPKWFADAPAAPPTPLNWYLDPIFENNTCYFAPRGVGLAWQGLGMGCHNPRLDLDNIECDYDVADPDDPSFCAPENVNIDFPPVDEWLRIGVHYFSSHGLGYDVHPKVKVFCDGALAAELGPSGYYAPEAAVTFAPNGGSSAALQNRFWIVADVAFTSRRCGSSLCAIKPIYEDAAGRTPLFRTGAEAAASVGPAYPALPPGP